MPVRYPRISRTTPTAIMGRGYPVRRASQTSTPALGRRPSRSWSSFSADSSRFKEYSLFRWFVFRPLPEFSYLQIGFKLLGVHGTFPAVAGFAHPFGVGAVVGRQIRVLNVQGDVSGSCVLLTAVVAPPVGVLAYRLAAMRASSASRSAMARASLARLVASWAARFAWPSATGWPRCAVSWPTGQRHQAARKQATRTARNSLNFVSVV
jgi:hypothetical protein